MVVPLELCRAQPVGHEAATLEDSPNNLPQGSDVPGGPPAFFFSPDNHLPRSKMPMGQRSRYGIIVVGGSRDPWRKALLPTSPLRYLRYSGKWSLSVLVTTRATSLQNPLWQALMLSLRRSSWALPPDTLSMSLMTQITEHLSMVCET